jgi:hypothetical protein
VLLQTGPSTRRSNVRDWKRDRYSQFHLVLAEQGLESVMVGQVWDAWGRQ